MGFEIEKKWIPDNKLIENIKKISKPVSIIQAYLCREPVIRIRKEDNNYYMTYKGSGFLKREEYNLPLNESSFYELLPKCSGKVISKNRYKVKIGEIFNNREANFLQSYGSLFMELDIFEGVHEGLTILEVEFPSVEVAENFISPEEFGRDVTQDREYTNSYISI